MKNRKAYQKAKKIAKARFQLEINIAAFVVVGILLIAINLSTTPEYLWFKWPLLVSSMAVFWYAITIIIFKGKYTIVNKFAQKEFDKKIKSIES